ncbi:MAG: hypothetical protein AB7V42_04435 [Thermoleophilia bacterium]
MSVTKQLLLLVLLLAISVAASACGGGGEADAPGPQADDSPEMLACIAWTTDRYASSKSQDLRDFEALVPDEVLASAAPSHCRSAVTDPVAEPDMFECVNYELGQARDWSTAQSECRGWTAVEGVYWRDFASLIDPNVLSSTEGSAVPAPSSPEVGPAPAPASTSAQAPQATAVDAASAFIAAPPPGVASTWARDLTFSADAYHVQGTGFSGEDSNWAYVCALSDQKGPASEPNAPDGYYTLLYLILRGDDAGWTVSYIGGPNYVWPPGGSLTGIPEDIWNPPPSCPGRQP